MHQPCLSDMPPRPKILNLLAGIFVRGATPDKQIKYGPLAQWLEQATHNRLVAGSSPARATKSLFTYQEELRVQGVLDGGLYFTTNAISRKKCGGWFRMRAGVLVRGTPLQCIYPSVLIQKYLEKMPAMPSGQIAYMWN